MGHVTKLTTSSMMIFLSRVNTDLSFNFMPYVELVVSMEPGVEIPPPPLPQGAGNILNGRLHEVFSL